VVSGEYELKSAISYCFRSPIANTTAEYMATGVLETRSVLLVNDVLDERETYARTLRAYGYQVVEAATSVAAYQIAITRRTDIVVTDVRLTGSMTGLELTRHLRILARTATVLVIVLTDVSLPQDAELSQGRGEQGSRESSVGGCATAKNRASFIDGCAPGQSAPTPGLEIMRPPVIPARGPEGRNS
jgi:CheY-like chemotaxis protein